MKFALALIALSLSATAAAQPPCRTKAAKPDAAKSVRAAQPSRILLIEKDRLGWLRSELFWRQIL